MITNYSLQWRPVNQEQTKNDANTVLPFTPRLVGLENRTGEIPMQYRVGKCISLKET